MGDHPLLKTGVGTQSLNVFEALVDSGLFCIRSIGGNTGKAHELKKIGVGSVKEYGDDFVAMCVPEFGDKESMRSFLRTERPDIIWFMTDPRFYEWLWDMEDEIRATTPMVYYHVWDNYPIPSYNEYYYDSTDEIVAISKLTKDVVEKVSKTHKDVKYIPHCIDSNQYKPLDDEEVSKFKKEFFPNIPDEARVFFYNSRNARRKQTGSLLFWFKELIDKVGRGKAHLLLKTDVCDYHGTDLEAIAVFLGITNDITFVTQVLPNEALNKLYNLADVTVSVSDAEGFGLSTLESMNAGTPIMAPATGGLSDQLRDDEGNLYGFEIPIASRAIVGSPQTPWVYEDRLSGDDVVSVMETIVNMSREDLKKMGARAREEHVMKNFNFENFKKEWVDFMLSVHEKHGSYPNKTYKKYEILDIVS